MVYLKKERKKQGEGFSKELHCFFLYHLVMFYVKKRSHLVVPNFNFLSFTVLRLGKKERSMFSASCSSFHVFLSTNVTFSLTQRPYFLSLLVIEVEKKFICFRPPVSSFHIYFAICIVRRKP